MGRFASNNDIILSGRASVTAPHTGHDVGVFIFFHFIMIAWHSFTNWQLVVLCQDIGSTLHDCMLLLCGLLIVLWHTSQHTVFCSSSISRNPIWHACNRTINCINITLGYVCCKRLVLCLNSNSLHCCSSSSSMLLSFQRRLHYPYRETHFRHYSHVLETLSSSVLLQQLLFSALLLLRLGQDCTWVACIIAFIPAYIAANSFNSGFIPHITL